MMPTHAAALFALLTLILTSGAWADRGGNGQHSQNGQRDRGTSSAQSDSRNRGEQRLRPAERSYRDNYRQDGQYDGYRRDDYRNDGYRRDHYRRDNYRVEDRRRYNSDAIQQRLHDGGSGNSGYYRRGAQRPVNDVIREVQDRYGGQVIGVQNSEGGSMYRVRVLQRDGRVKNVMVPAE